MPAPLMFIGSSKESRNIADALQENLRDEIDAFVWSQLGFAPSRDTLTSLERSLDDSDFAAFIFAPDDDLLTRGDATPAVRDNVLFELGLFMGRLGRDRTFIVQPASSTDPQHIPSDLFGLTALPYDPASVRGSDDARRRALLGAANDIRAVARRLKLRKGRGRGQERRIESVLSRGSTASIAALADGAIHVAEKRHEYFQNLRRYLRSGDIVPSKYLYWTPQGSAHWLELCKHGTYPYYRNSIDLLREHAEPLVAEVVQALGTAEIDLISVGSGDGAKDNILLRHLKDALEPEEFIYYYPVDISDTLIVEAVRCALGRGLPRKRFRVKALIADFLELAQLQVFYEERPSKNVFAVLGNTIGNADEDQLMGAVSNAMLDGDLVLVEVNAGVSSGPDPVWGDPAGAKHDFTPLAILNVPFEAEKLRYDTVEGESIVKGSRSVLTLYEEAMIGRERVRDIKLAIVHYYEFAAFKDRMEDRMNVRVLWSEASEDVGLVLAMREPGRGS